MRRAPPAPRSRAGGTARHRESGCRAPRPSSSFDPAPGPAATKSVFLRHARRGLAAGRDDRLLRPLAGVALEGAGGDDRESREHVRPAATAAPGPGVTGGRELHARGRPPLDDLAVPVDLEPVEQRVGDDAADAVDRGELVARWPRGSRRASRSSRRARGPRPDRRAGCSARRGSARAAWSWPSRGSASSLRRRLGGTWPASPSNAPSVSAGRTCLRLRRKGARVSGTPSSSQLRQPGLGVAHDDLDRQEVVDRELEEPGLGRQRRDLGHGRAG